MKLDSIDVNILNILLRNGRISYRIIAKSLQVSPPTISSKVERLERLGVIKRYEAVIDPAIFGQIVVFVVLDKLPEELLEVEACRIIYRLSDGRYFALLTVEDLEELSNILGSIRDRGINFEYYMAVGEPIKDEPIPRIKEGISLKIRCANCGKLIEGEPLKKSVLKTTYYFCSEQCMNNFLSKY